MRRKRNEKMISSHPPSASSASSKGLRKVQETRIYVRRDGVPMREEDSFLSMTRSVKR